MSSQPSGKPFAPVTSQDFRRACGRFATGVTIAGVMDSEGTPHGLTVSSFTSVSLEPPLVLICLGHAATAIDFFRASPYFGICVLDEHQTELSERFARKGHDRFGGLEWEAGATGAPLLKGVLATIECAVEQRFTAGDHDIFVGLMVAGNVTDGDPLVYYTGRYCRLAP